MRKNNNFKIFCKTGFTQKIHWKMSKFKELKIILKFEYMWMQSCVAKVMFWMYSENNKKKKSGKLLNS